MLNNNSEPSPRDNQYLPIAVVISRLAHAINTAISYQSNIVSITDHEAVSAVRRIEELKSNIDLLHGHPFSERDYTAMLAKISGLKADVERLKLNYSDACEAITNLETDCDQLKSWQEVMHVLVADIAAYTGEGPPTTPWQKIVKELSDRARAVLSRAPQPLPGEQPPAARAPDGYVYRYGDGFIRHSGGARINGSDPVEAIPYFYGSPQKLGGE